MRVIRQLAEAIARVAGFADKHDYDAALDEAGRAWDLLGVPRELVDRVDGPTLASLLREPAKLRAAAELLVAEAKAYAGKRDPMHAALCCIRDAGCRFLVAVRLDGGGRVHSLADVAIPQEFAQLFTAIPESRFRIDASSSDIRARRRTAP